jgi:hypothetical protein
MLKSIAGKGSEGIELKNGARIFFATRTGGGGRGLTVDLMVYDEAMHLTEDERSALTPTMAAQSMHGNTRRGTRARRSISRTRSMTAAARAGPRPWG